MSGGTGVGLWLTLRFRDADKMISWPTSIGFTERAIYRSERDPKLVEHAEMLWPQGGGIMFGSHRESAEWPVAPGTSAAYLVTDEPDRVYDAAVAAVGTPLRTPCDEDYAGRGAAVSDPEGSLWSFGSYRP